MWRFLLLFPSTKNQIRRGVGEISLFYRAHAVGNHDVLWGEWHRDSVHGRRTLGPPVKA